MEPPGAQVFFLSQLPIRARLRRLAVEVEIPSPTEDDRVRLFRAFLDGLELGDGLTVEELAAQRHVELCEGQVYRSFYP